VAVQPLVTTTLQAAAPPDALANVLLVIPTLNEEEGLGTVLGQARELGVATLVIDGGSDDRSVDIALAAGVAVEDVPRGKGRAWRHFLRSYPYEKYEYVAMVDADGSYDLGALPWMLRSDADMVVGCRRRERGSTPLHRLLGGKAITLAASLITLRSCPDVLSGLRLIRSDALRAIDLRSEEFGLEAELTIEFLRRGLKIEYVPAAYMPRYGRSKLRPVRDGLDILGTMLVARFRRL
jgi:dolichol-phosphate mannosyltransferase